MTTATTATQLPAPTPLTPKLLLARVDARLRLLRGWLSHDHADAPYWWARRTTAPAAQVERLRLRELANLLHVERATNRGRIHGTRFATLDEQHEWLKRWAADWLPARQLVALPDNATLVKLREGALLLEHATARLRG